MYQFVLHRVPGLLVIVASCSSLPAQGSQDPLNKPHPSLDLVHGAVKRVEERLAAEERLLKARISTEGSVDSLRVQLAKMRHDVALREDHPIVAREQRRLVREIRQRELERLQKARRPPAEIATARRRLATARYLVAQTEGENEVVLEQLRLIIHLCQQDLDVLKKLGRDVIPAFEVNAAESRLICAEYLLAVTEDKSDEIAPRLRSIAEVRDNEWKKTAKLRRQNATTIYEEHAAFMRLVNAQLRVANLEKKRDVVVKLLEDLIAKHEATLSAVDVKEKSQRLFDAIAFELSRDRHRLQSVSRGGALDVLAVPELD